jgi:TetR/AcrR family transcriptional regulator, regulator of cefoperazone and chloramphenicol sensitivity
MTTTERQHEEFVTRQRLLEAAGAVFADEGFRNATVRDICARARTNVASIRYHFGDKEQLYAAAVRYAHACGTSVPLDAGLAEGATPQQRLRAFVRGFLAGILEDGKPQWHAKLMAREIAEPTAVLDELARDAVKPRLALLCSIIREVVGEDVPQAVVFKCARSVVGQILFYHFARPMLERVFPDEALDSSAVDGLTDHITTFSLTGLRGVAAPAAKTNTTTRKARRK